MTLHRDTSKEPQMHRKSTPIQALNRFGLEKFCPDDWSEKAGSASPLKLRQMSPRFSEAALKIAQPFEDRASFIIHRGSQVRSKS
jgi:hypothetical protein